MEMVLSIPIAIKWERSDKKLSVLSAHVGKVAVKLPSELIKELDGVLDGSSGEDEAYVDVPVDIEYTYSPGDSDQFSGGRYLPGDQSEISIKKVEFGGADIYDSLSQRNIEKIVDAIYAANESLGEDAGKRLSNAIGRVEKKLYSRMHRGKIKPTLGKKGKSKIPGFGYWFKRN